MVVNGERINIPTHWRELKTRHYQRIIKEWDQDKDIADRDYFKLFNILADDRFSEFDRTIENQVKIETAVAWVVLENFKFSTEVPETITINGLTANVEKNIKQLTIGANIKARQWLDKSSLLVDDKGKLVSCDCYSMLVAIYLQPELNPTKKGGFNWNKAQELEKIITEMPIHEIQPIGFFLLQAVYKYGKRQEKTLLQILTNPVNKIRRMLRGLRKSRDLSLTQTSH